MTVGDIRRKIADLSRQHQEAKAEGNVMLLGDVTDNEADLYIQVLEAIAAGAMNPDALAREVLKARKLPFSRWYA